MNKRNKTIGILAVVLLVLVGVMFLKDYLPQGETTKDEYVANTAQLSAEQVEEIVVSQGEEEVVLSNDGGEWMAQGYVADKELIKDMLLALSEPGKVQLVSETNARHDALGVTNEASKLTIRSPGSELVLFMGESGKGGRYVRFEGQDKVYVIEGLTSVMSSTDAADWVSKTVVEVDESNVTKVKVVQATGTVELEQRDGDWYELGDETPLDRTKFSAMLNTLNSFVTQGLVSKEDEDGYAAKAVVTVEVIEKGKDPIELAFYEGEEDAVVTSSAKVGKFVISTSLLDTFKISRDDLVEKVDEVGEAEE